MTEYHTITRREERDDQDSLRIAVDREVSMVLNVNIAEPRDSLIPEREVSIVLETNEIIELYERCKGALESIGLPT